MQMEDAITVKEQLNQKQTNMFIIKVITENNETFFWTELSEREWELNPSQWYKFTNDIKDAYAYSSLEEFKASYYYTRPEHLWRKQYPEIKKFIAVDTSTLEYTEFDVTDNDYPIPSEILLPHHLFVRFTKTKIYARGFEKYEDLQTLWDERTYNLNYDMRDTDYVEVPKNALKTFIKASFTHRNHKYKTHYSDKPEFKFIYNYPELLKAALNTNIDPNDKITIKATLGIKSETDQFGREYVLYPVYDVVGDTKTPVMCKEWVKPYSTKKYTQYNRYLDKVERLVHEPLDSDIGKTHEYLRLNLAYKHFNNEYTPKGKIEPYLCTD
jgi:hypothetical protein